MFFFKNLDAKRVIKILDDLHKLVAFELGDSLGCQGYKLFETQMNVKQIGK